MPITDVARVLGHADVSFTLRTYVHHDKETAPTAGLIPMPSMASTLQIRGGRSGPASAPIMTGTRSGRQNHA